MKYLILCLLILGSISLEAQLFVLPKSEDAKALEKRKLIVQLIPASEDSMRRYRKNPDLQEDYLERIDKANEILRESMGKYWAFHSSPIFKELNELENFFADKDAIEYAILEADFGSDVRPDPSIKHIIGGFQINIYFAEKRKPIFTAMTLPLFINEFMYEFLLTNSQKYLEAITQGIDYKDESLWSMERNMKALEENTLLIPQNATKIDESEAKEIYNLPLSYVSDEEFVSSLRNKKTGVLVPLVIFHMKKNIWMYAITEPATMDIVSLTPVNSGINFSIVVTKPGYDKNDPFPVEVVELLSIKEVNGFGKKQFKAIPHKLGFKLNY